MPTPTVAIVIPTLNEAFNLREYLPDLVRMADEVVVSDGGSKDGTAQLAADLGARVVQAPLGRGSQLNRGARESSAEVLLFLHADTRLPTKALAAVRREVGRGRLGGGFCVRFDDDRWLFRLGSCLVNLRTRITRAPLGDQAQFVTREAFDALDGFRDWPILEDLDFIRRLKRRGSLAIIPEPVATSARRYLQQGTFRTIANNWLIWMLFSLGASPQRLARRYRPLR